jgi:hypothetical protein
MRISRSSCLAGHRWLLAAVLLISARLHGQSAAADHDRDVYWIVESPDDISVKQSTGEVALAKGPYNPLKRSDEVICHSKPVSSEPASKAKKSPAQAACAINYFDRADAPTSRLLLKIPVGKWVSLAKANLPEPDQFLPPSPDPKTMRRLGSAKSSGCTGTFPLEDPACDEVIDATDFTIRWGDISDAPEDVLIVVTSELSNKPPFRDDDVKVSAHRYNSEDLKKFLLDAQQLDHTTDLRLKVSVNQKQFATRHIKLLSRKREADLLHALDDIQKQSPSLLGELKALTAYIDFGYWNRAADKAVQLMKTAPPLDYVNGFVRAGLCESDGFINEKEELRSRMHLSGGSELCAVDVK